MKRIPILAVLFVAASGAGGQQTVYLRTYGTFLTYSSTTATTTLRLPTVSLADAQSFKNGEYVTIYHAGPPCPLPTPGAPVVAPAVNAGGVETTSARRGSTEFAYEIVAADKFGCYTAASAPGSTSTGNALGIETVPIVSGTRTDNLQTVETAKAHGFVPGQMVYIKYFSASDASFEGTWKVYTVPDPTHFTFLSSLDSRAGASTSFAGGAVIGFQANKISWTAVPGAWKYFIYGRTGGKFGCIGQTLFPYWVDYGSPMNDKQTFPAAIPLTAPSLGANDHLTTQIVFGGGTRTLTLAASAGASLSGVAIKSDDGPPLKAAASKTNGAKVYIPPAGIVLNSYTQLNQQFFVYNLDMAGNIQLNDTLEFDGGVSANGSGSTTNFAFSWANTPAFTGSAYPLINTASGPNHFERIAFNCGALNGCLIYAGGTANETFDYVVWATGAGQTSDCIGQHAIFDSGGFSFRFTFNTFMTSPCGPNSEASVGLSPIPSVVFTPRPSDNTPTANVGIQSCWFLNRGAFDLDSGTSVVGVPYSWMNDSQTQSSVMPILQFTGTGLAQGNFAIHGLIPADYPSAMIANYTDKTVTGIDVSEITAVQGGKNFFTGNPFAGVVGNNILTNLGINRDMTITGAATRFIVDGVFNSQPAGSSPGGGSIGLQSFNEITSIGHPYKLFVDGERPAAAGCLVGPGGALPPKATYSFSVAPVWSDNSVGRFGSFLNDCTTTAGNRTITINWTSIPGAKGYFLAVRGPNSPGAAGPLPPANNCNGESAYHPARSTSFVWTGSNSYNCGGSLPSAPGGGPTMMDAGGFYAPQLHLTPVLFRNLGTADNFTIKMCADCKIANPCSGGGTGALAKRLNNQWVCN